MAGAPAHPPRPPIRPDRPDRRRKEAADPPRRHRHRSRRSREPNTPKRCSAATGSRSSTECHHLPAVTFDQAVRRAPVTKWLGLTATPSRRDGLEGLLKMQCGPIRHEIPAKSTAAGLLRLELVVHETHSESPAEEDLPIQQILAAIAADDERNLSISADVANAANGERNSLVLTQRTDHIDRLVELLRERGVEPLVLRGGLNRGQRSIVKDVLADESRRASSSWAPARTSVRASTGRPSTPALPPRAARVARPSRAVSDGTSAFAATWTMPSLL